jgi:hypothetical protein
MNFVKKLSKMLSKILHYLFVGKSGPIFLATSVIKKTAQMKKFPNRRKFAQSGRPANGLWLELIMK